VVLVAQQTEARGGLSSSADQG